VFKKEKLAVGCQGILVVVQIKKKGKDGKRQDCYYARTFIETTR
jgi:hypothetical protein